MLRARVPIFIHVVLHIGALLPLILLAWDFTQGQLTANPIREVQLRTGRYALTLLVLSLACTPVYILSGYKPVLSLRRPLGLYAFAYASLHFLNFIGLDYRFNLSLLREDIFEKRYALVGFTAYLLLLPMAVTSTRGWMKRLGKTWQRLHYLAYAAGILAVLHFLWLVKTGIRDPLTYGVVLVLLLLIRIPEVRQIISQRLRPGVRL